MLVRQDGAKVSRQTSILWTLSTERFRTPPKAYP